MHAVCGVEFRFGLGLQCLLEFLVKGNVNVGKLGGQLAHDGNGAVDLTSPRLLCLIVQKEGAEEHDLGAGALTDLGEKGAVVATILSAFIIPVFNVLAVISLSVFNSGEKKGIDVKKILLGIAKNPLLHGILTGLIGLGIKSLLLQLGIDFRLSDLTVIYKPLTQLSSLATPLALLALGAQFEFSAISSMKNAIIVGVSVRTVIVPFLGVLIAYLMGCFEGAHFATFVAVFGTPVAVSSVPMAQEMDSDVALAGQLVVWTTMVSAFTLFIMTLVLKAIGVF